MARLTFVKKRLPDIVSFLFFISVWVSLSFWLRLWLLPALPTEATFTVAEHSIPPISAAANLFGGSQQASALASVQLNGVIRSTRPQESVVIIATEGGPPRALRLHAEVMPGIVVKEINSRSVILSASLCIATGRTTDHSGCHGAAERDTLQAISGAISDACHPAAISTSGEFEREFRCK